MSSCQFHYNEAHSYSQVSNNGTCLCQQCVLQHIARNIFQTENIAPLFSSHTKFINNTAITILIVTTYLVLNSHNLFLFEEQNECNKEDQLIMYEMSF